jgi:hypothetical protein
MKSYFDLIHQLNEAKDTSDPWEKAEELRKKAIKAWTMVLKDVELSKETRGAIDRRRYLLKISRYTPLQYSKLEVNNAIKKSLNPEVVLKAIKAELEFNKESLKKEKKQKELEANPIAICDILSDPSPKRFIKLIKDGGMDARIDAKWALDLENVASAFKEWFETVGGGKASMIKRFNEMVGCDSRAPWAAWSGKGYRGVARSPVKIKQFKFTGESKKIKGTEWLIAKGTYQSRYEAQSWTDDWGTAEKFSKSQGGSYSDHAMGVVYEVELKREDTLLSPDVVNKISPYGSKGEREVIRVGNKKIPLTVYVDTSAVSEIIEYYEPIKSMDTKRATKFVHDKAVALLGPKGADAFSRTATFKKLVKEFSR